MPPLPIAEIMFAMRKRIPIPALWIAGVTAVTELAPIKKLLRPVRMTAALPYFLVQAIPMYVTLAHVLRVVSGTARAAPLGA